MPSRLLDHALPPQPTPRHLRQKQPRPWPVLAPQLQLQLAQQLARLLRRVREEARHADRAR